MSVRRDYGNEKEKDEDEDGDEDRTFGVHLEKNVVDLGRIQLPQLLGEFWDNLRESAQVLVGRRLVQYARRSQKKRKVGRGSDCLMREAYRRTKVLGCVANVEGVFATVGIGAAPH